MRSAGWQRDRLEEGKGGRAEDRAGGGQLGREPRYRLMLALTHSLQGEDEGAVGAVAHLLLLLLTATPQHHLPVWR